MNRSERRRYEKQGYSKGSILVNDRKEAFDNGYKLGRSDALEIIFYMTCYTIQYKLGFGRKRLQELMKAIYDNIESFGTGQLYREDFETIKNQMINDYGVELKIK